MASRNWLRKLFNVSPPASAPSVEPGLYHAVHEGDEALTRLHLRVERDGSGLLIANAAAAARLNPTGVLIAHGLLKGKDGETILDELRDRFRGATPERMRADVERVEALLDRLTAPGDNYPIFNVDDAPFSPYGAELIAPLQASVPLAPPGTLVPLIDRLWEVGIPHVVFLASEETRPEDATRAVERAEDLGMIAGVRARATDLDTESLLGDLTVAGVDHLTVPYASSESAVHDALFGIEDHEAALRILTWLEEHEISAVAEVPLTQRTVETLEETMDHLVAMGADALSFVAYAAPAGTPHDEALPARALPQVAAHVEDAADRVRARFMWEPPVQRVPDLPLSGQVRAGPRCSADVGVRVETDGAVIPARGPYRSAGNLLRDAWEGIWNDDAFQRYRERVQSPTRCDTCPGLTICAADCPREPEGWAQPPLADSRPIGEER
jgi:radical SAM protein with 4Fe4S-binding SPASM domain